MSSAPLFRIISHRTKALLTASLACAGALGLASSAACASQVASVTVIKNITGQIPSGEEGDGIPQVTPPFKGSDGNYYGIAPIGGTYGNGIVYKVTPAGVFSVLHNFHDDEDSSPLVEEGDQPRVLIEGTDHNLYGVCYDGGKNDDEIYHNGAGTLFKITLGGTYTKLYDFEVGNVNTLAGNPCALVQGSDGNFYGLTEAGGKKSNSTGVFFKFVASSKTFTEVYDFQSTTSIGCQPQAQLLVGSDGNFYGTTTIGGTVNDEEAYGAIFKITKAGAATLVHNFLPDDNDPDASTPIPDSTPLIQGADGYLYGTTFTDAGDDNGTIYRCTTSGGSFKVVHTFEAGSDGAGPYGGLTQGADGNFYGGTDEGFGQTSDGETVGSLFQLQVTSAGVATFTTLHKFGTAETGAYGAASALTEVTPGTFYTLTEGGTDDIGTFAKVVVSPGITSSLTASATAGKAFTYTITATNDPAAYAATGLPSGLTVNTKTGVISGTPATSAVGVKTITLKATNAAGTTTATLKLTITAAAKPIITSATTATGTAGKAFTYQITASNSPTSFNATGLPSGLSVDKTTGKISGTIASTVKGVKTLTLTATNASGSGTATLTLTVNAS